MCLSLATLVALFLSQPADIPVLEVGKPVEGEISATDPPIETETLRTQYTDAPARGKTYRFQAAKAGRYHIDLQSHFFDAYLVLRDSTGAVVKEDDDGWMRTHSRIAVEFQAERSFTVEAVALHGAVGPFTLSLLEGTPAAVSAHEKKDVETADARLAVEQREGRWGSEHAGVAESLNNLAALLRSQGKYEEARPLYERALQIREKSLGADHPDTADSLNNLAALLFSQGKYEEARPLYERALKIKEKALGADHPDTATSLNDLAELLKSQGQYEEARPLFERALQIQEKALGADHPDTATSLNNLAALLRSQGKYEEARPLFERALQIREKALGADHPDTADSLNNLAAILYTQGKNEQARPLLERALKIKEKALGADHPDTATSLNDLAELLRSQGKYEEARPLFERALKIQEKALGADHPNTATSLNNLALLLRSQGKNEQARPLLERALQISEKTLGADHPNTAGSLYILAELLRSQGKYEEARPLYERALTIYEKSLGPAHRHTEVILNGLAQLLRSQGKYEEARPLYERALQIREKSLGADHPDTADSLNNLAALLFSQGKYEEARPLYERALKIKEKALGADHPDTATGLNNLAALLRFQGQYEEARPLFERALKIKEKALGADHPNTATSLNNLALLLRSQGKNEQARPLLERALQISEKTLGADHPDTATSLNDLAELLFSQGKYEEARPLFERALQIWEKALGADHPDTATSLNNLAALLKSQGQYEEARPLLERALKIKEKALGADHPDTATSLNDLAELLRSQGKYEEVRPLFERALQIWEKALGADHPNTATSLNNLALLLRSQGQYEEARPLFERALKIKEKALGADHPDTAVSLNNLAFLFYDMGEIPAAWRLVASSAGASDRRLRALVGSASEADALRYSAAEELIVATALSLASRPALAARRDEAYRVLLRWKGQASRSLSQSKVRLFQSLTDDQRRLVERLRSVQAGLSNLLAVREIKDRAEHERNLAFLRKEKTTLEAALRRSGGDFVEEKSISAADVGASLPAGSALVDFFVHRVYAPAEWNDGKVVRKGSWSEPRVSAWILHPGAKQALWLHLGASAPIEAAVKAFLEDLVLHRGVGGVTHRRAGPGPSPNDRLRQVLWDPLAKHVEEADRVFVCPDGFLGTLPFETLQAADGSYLAEKHALVYLQDALALVERSGRGEPKRDSTPSLLVAGAIDYDEREAPPSGAGLVADLRGDFQSTWLPLSETRRETDGIDHLFHRRFPEGRRLLVQERSATEERLKKELSGYSVVHLATHGYFQPEALPSMWEKLREESHDPVMMSHEERLVSGYLPGLLSGLVCAGANGEHAAGRENGLLTAEEVGWLDLGRCDLVVLSACDTALGTARAGEGMMSLRRAFHQAGAKTVISSLWNVRDESTKDLMIAFYERLWEKGQGKLEALRGAQLEMLRKNRAKYEGNALPSTWGAFVLSGEWR